jgi:hypothetical protein
MDFFTHIESEHHKERPTHHNDRMDEPRPLAEPPRRAYARLDRFDPDGAGGGRVAYDCIDADWFDEVGREVRWLGDPSVAEIGERISIVEEEQDSEWAGELEGVWFELDFETGDSEVEQYLNLFAEPLLRSMSAREAPPGKTDELTAKTGFSEEIRDASEGDIALLLGSLPTPGPAAVYDVGQGSSNAVLRDGIPVLYFDVGGGATSNTKTYPVPLRRFCVTEDPPVVLSHWDWDHWSSAYRDRRLLDLRWIVPRQSGRMGAVHTRLLGDLHSRGRLLVWPGHLTSISVRGLVLEQCTGSPGDRNNSGLALVLEGKVDGKDARMLFPGDAGYDNVRSAGGDFTSIVIPHHGGRTPTTQILMSDGLGVGRLVLSYGGGNAYWHPFPDVGRDHRRAGWKRRLHTALRDEQGLGHVHLYWDEADPAAAPPCHGQHCDLSCHQR